MAEYIDIGSVRKRQAVWPWEEWKKIPPGKAVRVDLNGKQSGNVARSLRAGITYHGVDLKIVTKGEEVYVGREEAEDNAGTD